MATVSKERSWDAFNSWCRDHGLAAAPAHPWTVAAYLRTMAAGVRLDALRRQLGHIGTMHYEKLRTRPDRHPIVIRTLESLRREREEAKKPKAPVLFQPGDFTAAEDAPKKAKAKPAKPAKPQKKRGLRATPKLVRRKRV